ncbi:MAG: TetR family transcriptional regulator, partial [Gammaproteobacteria bacterium]|nr:TetR family transcriptional regulator [Gammaproteobacteria bacterium]
SGYANTSIARIADAVGITEGNLWYHFRAKEDLVNAHVDQLVESLNDHYQEAQSRRSLEEEYVRYFHGVMQDMLHFRFIMRDYLQVASNKDSRISQHLATFQTDEYERLTDILARMRESGLMQTPLPDLDELATNIWIVVRYWWSYLLDREDVENVGWEHQQRGFRQHMALLEPHLKASVIRRMNAIATETELQEPAELVS